MTPIIIPNKWLRIGTYHSIVQIITLLIASKGYAIIFPLALAEINGWVILLHWLLLNYIVLPLLVKLLKKLPLKNWPSNLNRSFQILLLGPIYGVFSFIFDLSYSLFHAYSINKAFDKGAVLDNFVIVFTWMTLLVVLGETIRWVHEWHHSKID